MIKSLRTFFMSVYESSFFQLIKYIFIGPDFTVEGSSILENATNNGQT